jgi:hypothetical protein
MSSLELGGYRSLRTFGRFVCMGVLPSRERADDALNVINASGSGPELERLRGIAEAVQSGVLASQALCVEALRDLEQVFDGQGDPPRPGMGNA